MHFVDNIFLCACMCGPRIRHRKRSEVIIRPPFLITPLEARWYYYLRPIFCAFCSASRSARWIDFGAFVR